MIQSPGDLVKFSDSNIKGISIKLIPLSEILDEQLNVPETPYVETVCTFKMHMFKNSKTKAGFDYLQFFKIASNEKPFSTHWYRQPGDIIDPCGHFDIPDDNNIERTLW